MLPLVIMTAIALAPFAERATRFEDLGRLRVQECERVVALRTELTKCGAKVIEEGDTLTVFPSALHAAEIETYHDHRMAMCFAVLGLKVPGIKIKNPVRPLQGHSIMKFLLVISIHMISSISISTRFCLPIPL